MNSRTVESTIGSCASLASQSTLVLALNIANSKMQEIEAEMWVREQEKRRHREEQDRKLRETAARIKFD